MRMHTNTWQLVKVKYAELDVYECPSLFFWQGENSERMKSSSTWLLCYRSLPSTLFAEWQKTKLEAGVGVGAFVPNTLIVFLSLYWSARMTRRKRQRGRGTAGDTNFSQWHEKRLAGLWASPTMMHVRSCRRRRKTMQMLSCSGLLSNLRVRGEGVREQATDQQKYRWGRRPGRSPRAHEKSPPVSS